MKLKMSSLNFLLVVLNLSASSAQTDMEIRDDFKKTFDAYKVQGSFVLYDFKNEKYTVCNQDQFKRPFIPASTFKICNSLIALETNAVKDENVVFKWDGVDRSNPEWNKDQNMKEAFRNSTVWYYQELARRIGGRRMSYWLNKIKYGNADTSGGIDRFWLSGRLRITPEQQVQFLIRLYKDELPLSRQTMDIVKKIMIVQDTTGHTLRAKTGWSEQDGQSVGWYVGYVQTDDNAFFFSTCIQCADAKNPDFGRARAEITLSILHDLKVF
jgi:beta-lactamase class D